MAPKFALFTRGSKLPLKQGFQNRFLVTTVSRQALEIYYYTAKYFALISMRLGFVLTHTQTADLQTYQSPDGLCLCTQMK